MSTTRRPLRVLSWNIFNENPNTQRLVDCIRENNPDIVLIQEALSSHISTLLNSFEHVATARDYVCRGELCYLAIASNLKLSDIRIVEHFPDTKPPPSPLARWAGWIEFLDSLSARVQLSTTCSARLVVLHTSAATGPSHRKEEVRSVLEAHLEPGAPMLFAGDFNCFSSPWLTPLLALPFAYKKDDIFVRERRSLDEDLNSYCLRPAVQGVTFPRWNLQLDQIYFSRLQLSNSCIIREQFGSDHRPLLAEFIRRP